MARLQLPRRAEFLKKYKNGLPKATLWDPLDSCWYSWAPLGVPLNFFGVPLMSSWAPWDSPGDPIILFLNVDITFRANVAEKPRLCKQIKPPGIHPAAPVVPVRPPETVSETAAQTPLSTRAGR